VFSAKLQIERAINQMVKVDPTVDGFVADPHLCVVGKVDAESVGNLIRRPFLFDLGLDMSNQTDIVLALAMSWLLPFLKGQWMRPAVMVGRQGMFWPWLVGTRG